MNSRKEEALAHEFAFDHLALPRTLFANSHDCFYGANYSHAELRGDSSMPFMRPSNSYKLVLKSAASSSVFDDKSLCYGYHGTPVGNVKSILRAGHLTPSTSCWVRCPAKRGHPQLRG